MQDQPEISISQALNQLQSWLNAGEYDKVIQGAQEILELEPGNQRALALMRRAEDARQDRAMKAPEVPQPQAEPQAEPEVKAVEDPLEQLKVEPQNLMPEEPRLEHKNKLYLALLIPAVLVVLLGGGVIWGISKYQQRETLDEIEDQAPIVDSSYRERNEERMDTLTLMSEILNEYHQDEGDYPSVSQVEDVLLANGFDEIPLDPRHDERDEDGHLFGYAYAHYQDDYILSGLFEDSKGYGYIWTRGGSVQEHEDYRDFEEDHVHLLGDAKSDLDNEPKSKPKVKVRRTQ